MGAWGSGPFENDDAVDFLSNLVMTPPGGRAGQVRATLALPDRYVEIDEASAAVAAAALIAAARGMPVTAPVEFAELAQSGTIPSDHLSCEQAQAALTRVNAEGSEWRSLWMDSPLLAEATENLDLIRHHLAPGHMPISFS
jgi:uncharacterized protein DUF4259